MLLPRGVLSLRNVAAQEKTRYAMNGLLLTRTEDGKARVIATDGKALASVTFDDAPDVADYPSVEGVKIGRREDKKAPFFVLPVHAIQSAEKALPKRAVKPPQRLVCVDETMTDEGSVKLATLGADMTPTVASVRAVDGHFPPCDEVIESVQKATNKGIRIGINAGILYRLACALAESANAIGSHVQDTKEPAISLEMSSPQCGITVRVNGRKDVFGIIMPVNLDTGMQWDVEAWRAEMDAFAAWKASQGPAPLPQDKPESAENKPATDIPASTPEASQTPKRRGRKPMPRCATCEKILRPATESGLCALCQDSRDFGAILSLSADSREALRACDVDRVMTAASERGAEFLARFRDWMLGALGNYQHGTCGALTSWRPETPDVTIEVREPRTGVSETKTFPADTSTVPENKAPACQDAPPVATATDTPKTPASERDKPESVTDNPPVSLPSEPASRDGVENVNPFSGW